MEKESVSLVVPIYNAALYVRECLKRISEQTYSNFEVILVNDGSNDDSAEICKDFVKSDSRFELFNKANGGASDARNYGLLKATSEYICFIDADDEIGESYIEDLLNDIKVYNDLDLIIQGFVEVRDGIVRRFQLEDKIFPVTKKGLNDFFCGFDVSAFSAPYCKIYKRKIIVENNLYFSKAIIYREDYDFLLRYISLCRNIATSSKVNYKYLLRPTSISKRFYGFSKEYSGLCQIYSSFEELYKRFDSEAVKASGEIVAYDYLRRAVTSLYTSKTKYSDRISSYLQISNDFVEIVHQCVHPTTFFTKVTKYLLCSKKFRILDLVIILRRKF